MATIVLYPNSSANNTRTVVSTSTETYDTAETGQLYSSGSVYQYLNDALDSPDDDLTKYWHRGSHHSSLAGDARVNTTYTYVTRGSFDLCFASTYINGGTFSKESTVSLVVRGKFEQESPDISTGHMNSATTSSSLELGVYMAYSGSSFTEVAQVNDFNENWSTRTISFGGNLFSGVSSSHINIEDIKIRLVNTLTNQYTPTVQNGKRTARFSLTQVCLVIVDNEQVAVKTVGDGNLVYDGDFIFYKNTNPVVVPNMANSFVGVDWYDTGNTLVWPKENGIMTFSGNSDTTYQLVGTQNSQFLIKQTGAWATIQDMLVKKNGIWQHIDFNLEDLNKLHPMAKLVDVDIE